MEPAAMYARYFWISDRRDWRPRREAGCSEMRVARVVIVLSLMSRRCSTPISSDSSGSIAEGTWRNVLHVSALS
jgi:hypothetical protein